MSLPTFSSFDEATEALLEIVNLAIPNKTVFLTKRIQDGFLVEKVLDTGTGVKVAAGVKLEDKQSY